MTPRRRASPKSNMKGSFKNEQFRFNPKQKNDNNNDHKEDDNRMAKKNDQPKINLVTVGYNGDRAQFDKFIESMLLAYLNEGQDSLPKIAGEASVQKVEKDDKTA